MADIGITNEKKLKDWLKGKPRDWAQVIATRAALRVLPLTGCILRPSEISEELKIFFMGAVFRANFIAWAACVYPATKMSSAARSATRMAQIAIEAVASASHGVRSAYPVRSAASDSAVADVDSAANAIYSIFDAVASSRSTASYHAHAVIRAAEAADSAAKGSHDIWNEVGNDISRLEFEVNEPVRAAQRLAAKTLWLSAAPRWADVAWSECEVELHNGDPNWDHFSAWYSRRLLGRVGGFSVRSGNAETIDNRIATQSDRWWARGPEGTNRDIAEWIKRARGHRLPENVDDSHPSSATGFIVDYLRKIGRPARTAEIFEALMLAKKDIKRSSMHWILYRLIGRGQIEWISRGIYAAVITSVETALEGNKTQIDPPIEPWVDPIVSLNDQPFGFSFKELDSQLAIARSGEDTDLSSSRDAITRHLHSEASRRASDFAAIGGKLDNQIGWRGMGLAASRLFSILALGPEAVAERIAEVWADVVELGSFLEQDNSIRSGQSTFAEPLDPEMRRSLESLVTIASTYVRRYPTAATLDMEAGAFKTGQDLVPQARMIVEGARQSGLLNRNDAGILEAILSTAVRSDVQGSKARTVGVQSSRNIAGTSAKFIAAAYVSLVMGAAASNSILIGNGVAFVLATEKAIVEIVKDLPDHVSLAFKAMIEKLKTDPPALPEPPRLESPKDKRREEESDTDGGPKGRGSVRSRQ